MRQSLADRVAPYLEKVAALAPVAFATADWSEANSRPADQFIDALRSADLFRLLVPRAMGGAELSPWELRADHRGDGEDRRIGRLDAGARPGPARPTGCAGSVP